MIFFVAEKKIKTLNETEADEEEMEKAAAADETTEENKEEEASEGEDEDEQPELPSGLTGTESTSCIYSFIFIYRLYNNYY